MSQLNDILFIAYYFPPVGGAGVQRSLKFCCYLPDFAYRPVVLTGSGATLGRWEPIDQSLGHEIGEDCAVLRPSTPAPDARVSSRTARWLGRTSSFGRWWQREILTLGRKAAETHDLKAIFISLSPYEGLEAAVQLSRELQLPLIADLRDPWALDEVRIYPSAWHRRRELRKMERLLTACTRVIWNTPEARSAATDWIGSLDPDRQDCITNGYDAADFVDADTRHAGDEFRIVHTGYLHTAMGKAHRGRSALQRRLGGELFPVDFMTRSHCFLLDALERVQAEHPEASEKIELRLAGVLSRDDKERIEASSFRSKVVELGYLDHHATVREMLESDLLFLPMHDLPAGPRARIVPGKTYEYLATGRPILAAVPAGDAQDFVRAADAGRIVAPYDVDAMFEAILTELAASPRPRRETGWQIARFERRALTEALSKSLRLAIDGRDAAPRQDRGDAHESATTEVVKTPTPRA